MHDRKMIKCPSGFDVACKLRRRDRLWSQEMLSALLLAGQILFFVDAKSDFDAWTKNPSDAQKQFMSEHYYRMQTYSPYFDDRLGWYRNAWAYKDAMAIKPGWSVYGDHPDWVLRDSSGNQLYVRWGCSNGTCPQYAADIGNPDFRVSSGIWASGWMTSILTGALVTDLVKPSYRSIREPEN